MRIAFVYDAGDREGAIGGYFTRAAEALGLDAAHWTLAEASRESPVDLHIRVDHGDEYEVPWPEALHPCVFYAVDTHLPHSWRKIRRTAGWYDLVACCHRAAAEHLGAEWVPVGCDPEFHAAPPGVARDLDVAFVGTDGGVPRKLYLQALRERYTNSFIGLAPCADLATFYGRARIAFNYSIRDDVNMRMFEAMAAGAALVTNRLSHDDLDRLGLRDGEHFLSYRGARELFGLIERLRGDADERERIADAGRRAVLAAHTYRHRLAQLLSLAESHLSVRIFEGQGAGGKGHENAPAPRPVPLAPR